MQRNPYWPLKGPPFFGSENPSLCFFSLHERRRRLQVKFRGADGKPTEPLFPRRTSIRMTAARTTIILILSTNAGSGDQRRLSMLLIRLAQSCTLSPDFARCSAGFGP